MKATVLILLALLASTGLLDAAGPWKEFNSRDGGYSVLLPGTGIESREPVQTPVGEGRVWRVMMEWPGAGAVDTAVGVICTEYPVKNIDPSETEKLIDSARDGSQKAFGGKIREEHKVEMGSTVGREVSMEADQTVVRTRLFWVSPRLYQIMLVTTKEREKEIAADSDNFFNSFKVTR